MERTTGSGNHYAQADDPSQRLLNSTIELARRLWLLPGEIGIYAEESRNPAKEGRLCIEEVHASKPCQLAGLFCI